MNFMEIVQQNLYIFCIMGAAMVISLIYAIIRSKKMKADGANFLTKHPDAARVYLTAKALVTTEAVTVYTVDDAPPSRFLESGKNGFYLAPGQSKVSISYSYTRPGVLHKTVTTSTDVVEKVLEVEANRSYILGFDRKAECFTFEEFES